jgi:precorrin-2 dehydrogenase/sirohydrochlorin ferrochelatase
MFPLVADLRGRSALVVGAGRVGVHKAAQLIDAGASVTVVTDQVLAPLPDGLAHLVLRPYREGDLEGRFLCVAATGRADVNDAIVDEANRRNMLLNVVDDLGRSNFFFTAVHRDGDVVVSVSTGGASPALAQWIRHTVVRSLPTNLAAVARRLRAERAALHDEGQSTEGRDWMTRVRELVNATDD